MADGNSDIYEKVFGEKIGNVEYIDRVGVYGIVTNNEESVATIKIPKGYFLPGGGIEKSENHEQCLKREFMEETGYDVEMGNFIGKSSSYCISETNECRHVIGYFYSVSLNSKICEKIEEDHELLWLESKYCINNLFLEHQSWAVAKALKINI